MGNINVANVATVEPEHVPIDDNTLAKMSREDIKEQLQICQHETGRKQEGYARQI